MPSSSGGGFGGGGSFGGGGGFHSSGSHSSSGPIRTISTRPFAGATRYSYINRHGMICVFYSMGRPKRMNATSSLILTGIIILVGLIISGFIIGSLIPKKIPERLCDKTEINYIDNAGIVDKESTDNAFNAFYEQTGIQPFLYTIKAEDFPKQYGPITKYSLEDYAYDLYVDRLFNDEGHWLLVFVDFGNEDPYFGWVDMAGDNTRNIINDEFFKSFQLDLQTKLNEQSHKESPAYSKAIAESVENTLSYAFKITGEKIIQIVFISIIALAIVGYLIYSIVKTVKTQLMVNGYLDCEENNPSAIIKEDVPFKEKEVPQDPFG